MNWEQLFQNEKNKQYYQQLMTKLENQVCYPPKHQWFEAFRLCSFENVKVVLIGQDPYIHEHQAHGLSFSVLCGKTPPSLLNIKKELAIEYGYPITNKTNLTCWAKQGVLLLNRVLTVTPKIANSHKDYGWENFSDAVIKHISDNKEHVVFLLFGSQAQQLEKIIDTKKHTIIKAPHPSPLSAYRGFFNSNVFIKTNEQLIKHGQQPIYWEII